MKIPRREYPGPVPTLNPRLLGGILPGLNAVPDNARGDVILNAQQIMKRDTIFVLADPDEPILDSLEALRADANIVRGNSPECFSAAASAATVIFNWSGSLPLFRTVFLLCPNLKWVHSRSVGLERSLFPELVESPVILTNGVGVFSASLGEFALGAILYFAKDFRRMVRNQIAGIWEQFDVVPVSGQTVGIVGYGDIGRAVAARVRPLGMSVLALKRHVPPSGHHEELVDEFYTTARRLEMLARSDYIVIATPLTEETRNLIGEAEFGAMRPTAVVINVGRGPIINEEAMIRALSTNRIKGAALDVFEQEPLPAGHAFYRLENVLLSPHCADHTPNWLEDAVRLFLDQFARYRAGQPLANIVKKNLGY
jgi:phosphoglycerate dehydrogenase-like enzyme